MVFLYSCLFSVIFLIGGVLCGSGSGDITVENGTKIKYQESWGYTTVRSRAHTFWWLYYVQQEEPRPLVLWLQGGPGASGTGFGNFQEIGPKDADLQGRNTTWLQKADLVFVDNPVGTGYSYVEDSSLYTTDVQMIADDLLTWAHDFFHEQHPEFQSRPFYIFCESYGGKMTAAFAWTLWQAIEAGNIRVNFKGVALGDSWISAEDYIMTWGPYLKTNSYLDNTELAEVEAQATSCQSHISKGSWVEATNCWTELEELIILKTDGVSWYNILKQSGQDPWSGEKDKSAASNTVFGQQPFQKAARRRVYGYTQSLSALMNSPEMKKKLNIQDDVTWGGQSGDVFTYQKGDFMKPVIETVDKLLSNTTLKVVVFNGQLDLICDTPGTLRWIEKLKWSGIVNWFGAERNPIQTGWLANGYGRLSGYYKTYDQFTMYWILRAGHMVAHDAAVTALDMVGRIVA